MTRRASLRTVIDEHNYLNGLRFVTAEFLLVAAAATFIGAAAASHGTIILALVGFGITANALTLVAISSAQLHHHQPSKSLLKYRSAAFRRWVSKNHPHLASHTTYLCLLLLLPAAVPLTLATQRRHHRPPSTAMAGGESARTEPE